MEPGTGSVRLVVTPDDGGNVDDEHRGHIEAFMQTFPVAGFNALDGLRKILRTCTRPAVVDMLCEGMVVVLPPNPRYYRVALAEESGYIFGHINVEDADSPVSALAEGRAKFARVYSQEPEIQAQLRARLHHFIVRHVDSGAEMTFPAGAQA
jgi:hypothetical protein